MGKKEEGQKSLRDKMVDSVMGVRKPTFKRSYNPTRLNSNYLFHSMTMMMVGVVMMLVGVVIMIVVGMVMVVGVVIMMMVGVIGIF